ncbi:MAG: hypothetical protein MI808_22065 [Pseudomonadales bacterium]|nr:hypothetical protein [Pseudomonadales bacterium]
MNQTPISERNLLRRLNRKLAKENLIVKTSPVNSRWYNENGRHYCVDESTNVIRSQHIDIEQWARDEGCLAPSECLTTLVDAFMEKLATGQINLKDK